VELNYEEMVMLDAEDLAEGGIKQAYDSLLDRLKAHVAQPLAVQERVDGDAPSYAVLVEGTEHVVYGPGVDEEDAWGRATVILFNIVNGQLAASQYRLYAINGGNDLGGMLLTEREAEEAKKSLPERSDWPYIPIDSPPWFGQFH
jgi:hypothetical protein